MIDGVADLESTAEGPWFPGHHARLDPQRICLVDSTGAELSFGELDAMANRFARWLAAADVGDGDHISLLVDSGVEVPGLWWGAVYGGQRFTPINTHLRPAEVAHIIIDAGSRVVVTTKDAVEVAELTSLIPAAAKVVALDDLLAELEEVSADPYRGLGQGAVMYYSSGTTGFPKGIVKPRPAGPLGSDGKHPTALGDLYGCGTDTVYLSPAPLYHAAPYRYVLSINAMGGRTIQMKRFDPEQALTLIERHRVTHAQFVPTMFVQMLALPDEVRARYDVSSLRAVLHAAAPCPVGVKRRMIDWFGPIIHEFYGGSEGVGATYCTPEEWLARPGTVGRPRAGAVHILDDEGRELPPGVDGSIFFSGGPRFVYLGDPDKTAAAQSGAGMATYGDFGHVDDDGYLFISDRRTDMVTIGGVNVYPQEAENCLIEHPVVADVAVVGIPDPEKGARLVAAVQLVPGHGVEGVDGELLAHCRSLLSSIKCPREIVVRERLPRDPNGKMLRRLVRDELVSARDL